ncbi:MAG: DUF3320 domain-containing protein [Solobacterium sp.]|nr:DUF3320 domain-containing protein [Solobacterium sp.]
MSSFKKKIYQVTDLPFTSVSSKDFLENPPVAEIKKRIQTVIKKEAPITEWLLIKRVINSFDIWRSGSSIKELMTDVLLSMPLAKTAEHNDSVYWKKQSDPASYNEYRIFGNDDLSCRDVMQVPEAELANALCAVLSEKGSLPYDELTRETAALMGYTKMGSNVKACMDNAVKYSVKHKKIQKKKELYALK